MTDAWSTRAELYLDSDAHRGGPDLDIMVDWAFGAETALDVATGGGHVARRFRDIGIQVVTCDPAPGMKPDVVCVAEELPFADQSFDVVACRVAAHHFTDVHKAVHEMARVARDRVLVADTLFMGEEVERAEKLRDPSHVRNYSEEEWRSFLTEARLVVHDARFTAKPMNRAAWLERTGCVGEEAQQAIAYLGDRVRGDWITFDRIVLKAGKG
jgi:ubiquinone/menaquinone biosynthesis C-methylase UbiE